MYQINQAVVFDESGEQHETYGLIYNNTVINDISTDKEKVERLVALCNELELSPIHIYDVIDDFLVDFEI